MTTWLRQGLVPGVLAGLAGGLVFAAAMAQLGVLPAIAALVGADSALIGLLVHLLAGALVGAGLGALAWRQRIASSEMLYWGLAYGALWWFLGPLTLMPLLLGYGLTWTLPAAQATVPLLLGNLLYGAVAALALALLHPNRADPTPVGRGALARGAAAGLLSAAVLILGVSLHPVLARTIFGAPPPPAIAVFLLVGLLAGLGYALLDPQPAPGAGPGLVRGALYGFFWWVAGALTALPLALYGELPWTVGPVRSGFVVLPGLLLFGAALVLIYQGLGTVGRLLFSASIPELHQEGAGTEGLRAIGHGIAAGLVGGLLFAVIMQQIGYLPQVARLVGSTAPLAGFLVHLGIAVLVGASYTLLFRRQTFDLGAAVGWGMSYGVVWWVLGPLTLMPVLLGGEPRWTAEAAAASFPTLIGHLAYGMGLGITFYLLELRSHPWWVPPQHATATRASRRQEQLASSAPALWALVVTIALTLPIVLSRGAPGIR